MTQIKHPAERYNYIVKEIESGESFVWTITDILEEINRGRGDDWEAYDIDDWREGWDEWIDGEDYRITGIQLK